MSNSKEPAGMSRRHMLKLTAAGAAGLTLLKRNSDARPLTHESFVDATAVERIADRDATVHPPLLIDLQTHIWWRAGGVARMNARAEAFLKGMAGYRASFT
ncbi:MAG TPA: hypothetical protein VLG74_08675, partial [Blastocatellia bacterium]|nr:hypothetical protein [Blastocatellia bacterium]